MKNKDFDKEWIYYETLVPGYVEKYSMRGIRARNKAILDKLNDNDNPKEVRNLKDKLIENNLPLAKRFAERIGDTANWNRETREDAYCECCLALTKMVNELDTHDHDMCGKYFQTRLAFNLRNHLYYETCVKKNDTNMCEFVPFVEEEHPVEDKENLRLNLPLIINIIDRCSLPDRYRDAFVLFFNGDPEESSEPWDLETIADKIGLTRERTRQIVVKVTQKLERIIRHHIREKNYCIEDFFTCQNDINLERVTLKMQKRKPAWFEKYL